MTGPAPDQARDAGWEAHRAAIAHLEACGEAMYTEEETGVEVESPAVGPYCGCSDCDIREVLAVAWPILLDDAAGTVERGGHPGAAALLRAEITRLRQVLAVVPATTH
ncbi:hypothetical protein [Actinoplanes sp. L3-i22]|uniref:hypothetical protein n=1 Tax=Actinoplanes sp. L3-i22 TaxID=2836373 RepID=UPI001C7610F9|nr:hypothetical protein [Actinoplanes sp. L3-i22]BCY10969.1 hypothetical protein L3i22_060570 [Actinoplanes sp. L3-i22]